MRLIGQAPYMLPTMDLNEALYTTRAMRRTSPEPIPEDSVKRMLDAAVRAPSGGNNQNWRFMTVTDPEVRSNLGPIYRDAFQILNETIYKGAGERAREAGDKQALAVMRSSQWLADNFEQVPLWFMVFHRNDPSGSSIYPAVWNLMLAARGLGIGTCMTTILGFLKADDTFDVLGVPKDKGWQLAASVSAGYPTGRWGLAKRAPVEDVVYADRWGEKVPWTIAEPYWTPDPA